MSGQILVIGAANTDLTAYVDRIPEGGETIHGNIFTTGFGGKGANQAVAAKRAGAKVALIAGLGVGGIAIALAAQAVLGDLFSYFVIFSNCENKYFILHFDCCCLRH